MKQSSIPCPCAVVAALALAGSPAATRAAELPDHESLFTGTYLERVEPAAGNTARVERITVADQPFKSGVKITNMSQIHGK